MDIATLGIAVDSGEAKAAATDLDKLTQSGTRTESAMGKVSAAAKKTAADVNSIGMSAKQTAFAMRQLPMQMTDIAVGLSTGQSPFYVLLQQGGQLKDVFGGIGPAVRAVGGYVAALINPFTVAAGVAGALALAYKQGSDEQTAFTKSLITTGGVAGVTTGQLADMASAIDDQVGTAHQAAAALAQLVGTGRIYGDQLQELAQSAVAWDRATGTAVEDTVRIFAELAKDPVQASAKLNETMHYLTLSVYEQIKALQDQGRTQQAAVVAEKAYATALDDRSKEIEKSLGLIETAWRDVKSGAAEAWDTMLGIGRENTIDEQIKKLTSLRQFATPWKQAQIDADLDQLNTQKLLEEGNARMWAEEKRIQQAGIDAENTVAKLREESLSNAERREKAIADYRANIERIRTANPESPLLDPSKISRDERNIRDKFKDQGVNLGNLDASINQEFDALARKAKESSEIMREVAKSNEEYFNGISKSIETARTNVSSIEDYLLTDEERLAQSYERRKGMLDQANDYGLISEERYLDLKQKLNEKYNQEAERMQAQNTAYILGNAAQVFDGLAGIAEVSAGKQSALYKTMFAASKAFSIAQAIINTEEAATKALTLGPILGIPASTLVRALGYTSVAMIAGQAIAGIAHDGMSNIPREGTWLLNGGERVIAPQQNKDLTRFLANQTTNNNQRNVTINLNGVQDADSFRKSRRQIERELRSVAG